VVPVISQALGIGGLSGVIGFVAGERRVRST
jgi:hypothetical protein